MKLDDAHNRRELKHVGIGLTEKEALELRDSLDALLEDSGQRHEHVSSESYDNELTIWLIRE